MLPKLIITDIDGVWTDGSMYYDQEGNELKRFHTYDSAGVLFAKLLEIPVAIITGENTEIVNRRAQKVKIDFLYQGVDDKVEIVESLIEKLGITFNECAFIGDDINDILLLEKVGLSACTMNAPIYIKEKVHYVTEKRGGDGAFREFVEFILEKNDALYDIIKKAVMKHKKTG